jgi:hypothetical protein
MFPSESPQENGQARDDSVILHDEFGRSLSCYVEHSFELNGQDYVLLMPVESPVEIFTWQAEDEDEEPIPVDDDRVDRIFETAKAVLAEQNLTLKRTAIVLTVAGELPDFSEEDWNDEEAEPPADAREDYEELQWLASFYDEEEEYAIYTPLDPVFILARVNDAGEPELLSQEELDELEPLLPSLEGMLEDRLFDESD